MLLPKDPELDKISPEEDPRKELVDRLLEHDGSRTRRKCCNRTNGGGSSLVEPANQPVSLRGRRSRASRHTLRSGQDIQTVLDRQESSSIRGRKKDISVPDMIRYLEKFFAMSANPIHLSSRTLRPAAQPARHDLYVLAILELVRRQALALTRRMLSATLD